MSIEKPLNAWPMLRKICFGCLIPPPIIVLLSFSFISLKLHASYPSYYSTFYPGYVILKNKDSLAGQILIAPGYSRETKYRRLEDCVVVRTFDCATCMTSEITITKANISRLRLRYHVLYFDGVAYSENYSPKSFWPRKDPDSIVEKSTEFMNLTYKGQEHLSRLVSSGKIKIYDSFENPEQGIAEGWATSNFLTPVYTSLFGRHHFVMVNDGRPEVIPGRFEFRFNFRRSKFLARFINRRYGTSFRLGHFATNMQMIDYIAANG